MNDDGTVTLLEADVQHCYDLAEVGAHVRNLALLVDQLGHGTPLASVVYLGTLDPLSDLLRWCQGDRKAAERVKAWAESVR